jgi:hypothetical protein
VQHLKEADMTKVNEGISMGFTNVRFPAGTHMCLIYSDEEERRRTISRFLHSGFAGGEQVAYFADGMSSEEVFHWIKESGVDVEGMAESARMEILRAENVYCPEGKFVPKVMHDNIRRFYDGSVESGCPGVRASGEMSWATKGIPGSERLIEYESLLNNVLVTHPLTAVCQYDANLFDGAAILNVLRVHPMMIVHGQILQNPYYIKPEEFLKNLNR